MPSQFRASLQIVQAARVVLFSGGLYEKESNSEWVLSVEVMFRYRITLICIYIYMFFVHY